MFFIYYLFIFLLGLIVGSFLNCLIWRLHTGETMMNRSHCPKCEHKIAWYDNIPVLSYFLLLGRCRHCKRGISWQYPVLELVTGFLFLLAFFVNFGFPTTYIDFVDAVSQNPQAVIQFFLDCFVVFIMIIVFIYDLRWYTILDRVMIPAFLVVASVNFLLYYFDGELGLSLLKMLFSAIIGGGFFLLQFLLSKGKWIGGGDVRLGFLMGLILSWQELIFALMIAYLSGAFVGLTLIALGKKKLSSKLPFGVFLSVTTLVAMFWGGEIINWYLSIFDL